LQRGLDKKARRERLKSHKVEEVEGPPNPSSDGDSDDEGLDLSDRCWKDGIDDIWMTDFPPPEGFTGYESRPYDEPEDDERYVRACTEQEVAILEADAARARAVYRAEDEALRDAWFELLESEAAEAAPVKSSPTP
jgi:hypothetical protein